MGKFHELGLPQTQATKEKINWIMSKWKTFVHQRTLATV
jgi:hypothetical protein